MSNPIKIRAKLKGDVVIVKSLIPHPMETGMRKDKETGELIPAHFIEEVVFKHNDKPVMTIQSSGGVSKNPFFGFQFKGGAQGDTIELTWTDNKGETGSATTEIK